MHSLQAEHRRTCLEVKLLQILSNAKTFTKVHIYAKIQTIKKVHGVLVGIFLYWDAVPTAFVIWDRVFLTQNGAFGLKIVHNHRLCNAQLIFVISASVSPQLTMLGMNNK